MHAQSWRDTYTDLQPGTTAQWVEAALVERTGPSFVAQRRGHIAGAQQDPEHRFFHVARDRDGEVIGLAGGERDEGRQQINAFYVDRAWHGLGVAQALAEALEAWLEPTSTTGLWVAVGNARAIAFYEHLGFRLVAESEHDPGSGLIEIEMQRPPTKDGT